MTSQFKFLFFTVLTPDFRPPVADPLARYFEMFFLSKGVYKILSRPKFLFEIPSCSEVIKKIHQGGACDPKPHERISLCCFCCLLFIYHLLIFAWEGFADLHVKQQEV